MAKVTVTLAQITCRLHDKAANLRRMTEVVRKTKGDIVIFPELSLTGYLPRDDLFAQAEPTNGPSMRRMLQLAKATRKDVVFGAPVKDPKVSGLVYNSCLLASGRGRLYRYDKVYLANFGPFEEKVYFAPGRSAVVGEGLHARLGLMVCYDMFFPELSKLETLEGAQMLVNISAAPTTSKPSFLKVIPGRAVENALFVAYTNMVGVHGGLVFGGGSVLYGPRGEELVKAEDLHEDVVEHAIDLGDIAVARKFRPTVRDTRPEVIDEIGSVIRGQRKG